MSYVWDIQITNILECHMYGISKSQIFLNVICVGYLNHKYLYQGYSMALDTSPPGAPAALRALQRLRARVAGATALLAPCFATAMRSSSVSATDRPPRRCLPSPNCHSHWLISYTLLPFLPYSEATHRLHLPAHVETWRPGAGGAGVGWSE